MRKTADKKSMSRLPLFLTLCLFVALSVFFFNACSGALSKRAAILSSISSNLPQAQAPISEGEADALAQEATKPEEIQQDDPEEFNYFPYDLQLDTLAYMTSSGGPDGFSFKAGAYFERSGLRLSEYFLRKKSSLSSSTDLKELMESSTKYRAQAHFAMAGKINLSEPVQPTAVFPLTLHHLTDELISAGTNRIRTVNDDPIEASLKFGLSTSPIISLKGGKWLLALYYKGAKGVLHKTGGRPGLDIYGRTYAIGVEEQLSNRNIVRHVLSSVLEKKLLSDETQAEWACPSSLRFEVRRHEKQAYNARRYYDARSAQYKDENTFEEALNLEGNQRILQSEETCPSANESSNPAFIVARRVLGTEWNINIAQNCINLKSPGSAFYTSPEPVVLQRDGRLANKGDTNCEYSIKNYCPHYLSICVRKN